MVLVDTGKPARYNYRTHFAERCRSGRTGTTGNRVGAYASRGFESLSLRQFLFRYRPTGPRNILIHIYEAAVTFLILPLVWEKMWERREHG